MDKNSLAKLVPSRNNAILAYRIFDDQTVLVDLVQGTLNMLNTTATRVWQLINKNLRGIKNGRTILNQPKDWMEKH